MPRCTWTQHLLPTIRPWLPLIVSHRSLSSPALHFPSCILTCAAPQTPCYCFVFNGRRLKCTPRRLESHASDPHPYTHLRTHPQSDSLPFTSQRKLNDTALSLPLRLLSRSNQRSVRLSQCRFIHAIAHATLLHLRVLTSGTWPQLYLSLTHAVAGFTRATLPQEGITRESPKST